MLSKEKAGLLVFGLFFFKLNADIVTAVKESQIDTFNKFKQWSYEMEMFSAEQNILAWKTCMKI